MRFVVKTYEDGNMFAVEISDDGSSVMNTLKGARDVGKRLSVFVEVLGDDTEVGVTRIKDALEFLAEVIAERGAKLAQKMSPSSGKKR
jgi:hypothetical protein